MPTKESRCHSRHLDQVEMLTGRTPSPLVAKAKEKGLTEKITVRMRSSRLAGPEVSEARSERSARAAVPEVT